MKKRLLVLGIAMVGVFGLTACGHEHTFAEATCTAPKTCTECGETEGEALGHTFEEATCTAPKTCSVCGETEGEALGHTWTEATCTELKTCSTCGETEGELAEHEWVEGNEYTATFCANCNKMMTGDEWYAIDGNKERLQESCDAAMVDYSEYYSSIQAYVEDNTFVYEYYFTEEISDYVDAAALDENLSSYDPEETCNLTQAEWGVGDTKVKFAYYTYDGALVVDALYER